MIEELARHRCIGCSGKPLFVVEHRHVFTTHGGAGTRHHRGVAWATLLNGEPVRHINAQTFEIIATGELLAHDTQHCGCAPAVRFATSTGIQNA
jgi:hypothetical protein